MKLKENIKTLESVLNDLSEKIKRLSTYNAGYSSKSASTIQDEVLKIIDLTIIDTYKDIILNDESELLKELSKLEAKVFVYEEIIKKSNFKSLVEGTCDINIEKGLVE